METGRLLRARLDLIRQQVVDAFRGVHYEPNELTSGAQNEHLRAHSERIAHEAAEAALRSMNEDPRADSGFGFPGRG